MRRLRLALLLTALALAALLVWLMAGGCGGLCGDDLSRDPGEAARRAAVEMGLTALPEGVAGVAAREGGFADRFVQIRLTASDSGLDALLAALGTGRDELMHGDTPALGPPGQDWWRSPEGGDWAWIDLDAPALSQLRLALHRAPDGTGPWALYLWGYAS